jgi:hypothetical protein
MMLIIDGVFVIHDGAHRLRFAHHPIRPDGGVSMSHTPPSVMLDHLWPSRPTGAHVRQQVAHGQKAVVIVDADDDGSVSIPSSQRDRLPKDAFLPNSSVDGFQTFSIPFFDWLRPADRARGLAFLAEQRKPGPRATTEAPTYKVEESLIGSPETLRFMVQFRPMGISALQTALRHLYESAPARPNHLINRTYGPAVARRRIGAAA